MTTVAELISQARGALTNEPVDSGPVDLLTEGDPRLVLPAKARPGAKSLAVITCAPKHHALGVRGDSLVSCGLRDLQYGANRGKRLIGRLRVDLEQVSLTGHHAIFEDQEGYQAQISIFYADKALLSTFPQFELREPFVKRSANGLPVIRVDSPTDLRRHEADIRQSAFRGDSAAVDGARANAKKLFAAGQYAQAAHIWASLCVLDYPPSEVFALRLNIAIAYLRLKRPGAALAELFIAEGLAKRHVVGETQAQKLHYRLGEAFYGLQRYSLAIVQYGKLPSTLAGSRGCECEIRMREQSEGAYDWLALFRQLKAGTDVLDIADYMSAKVHVEDLPGRGRGVVAKEALEPGELLLVEHPIGLARPLRPDSDTPVIVGLNLATEVLMPPVQTAVIARAFSAALDDDGRKDDLLDLYAGSNYAQPKARRAPNAYTSVPLDAGRVEGANTYNSFRVRCVSEPIIAEALDADEEDIDDGTSALYYRASMLNHACEPNAIYTFFGVHFVLRATKHIEPGEEVTVSYVDPTANLLDRQAALKPHFPADTVCTCSLCELDRQGDYARRKKLIQAAQPLHRHSPQALQKLVDRLVSTYAASSRMKAELYPIAEALVDAIGRSSDPTSPSPIAGPVHCSQRRALDCLCHLVEDEEVLLGYHQATILCCIDLHLRHHLNNKNKVETAAWLPPGYTHLEIAKTVHDTIFGPGLFEARMGDYMAARSRAIAAELQ